MRTKEEIEQKIREIQKEIDSGKVESITNVQGWEGVKIALLWCLQTKEAKK